MDDFEKIVSITQEKLAISRDFYDISLRLKQIANQDEDIEYILDERQELIDTVDILDRQFLELYEKIKKIENFENELKKYPQIFQGIDEIRENFKKSYQIDNDIMPYMNQKFDEIKSEMKKLKEQTKVNEKYGQEAINKITSSNFGVFFDETK